MDPRRVSYPQPSCQRERRKNECGQTKSLLRYVIGLQQVTSGQNLKGLYIMAT
jgi:hypothetical protein